MVRSVAVIAWAISFASPSLPKNVAHSYAKTIRAEARNHHIDPFTIISIIRHESRFRASAISSDGEDYGLGQIRARFLKACRKDKNPVHAPSPKCKVAKMRLLHGPANIRHLAGAISQWRKTCRRITGKPALFARWLHGYGGMGNLRRNKICGMKKTRGKWRDIPVRRLLKNIIQYRLRLVRASRRRQ